MSHWLAWRSPREWAPEGWLWAGQAGHHLRSVLGKDADVLVRGSLEALLDQRRAHALRHLLHLEREENQRQLRPDRRNRTRTAEQHRTEQV